jgi:NAD(P)-dependent dehydrogenase (short-subunit alcohol dehydrogenase family)
VLITGAGGGLGAATARRLAGQGWRVFAADLNPPPAAPGIVPLQVDVTSDESVAALLDEVSQQSQGLQGVVTFAGILRVGALMDLEADLIRQVLDVNLLGSHRTVRAALPLIRAGKGRVVLISSETGFQSGAPFNGVYGLSKHAVEAYGDSLRRELMFLDVPVVKIQPGPFRTEMVASILPIYEKAAAASEHFGELLSVLIKRLPAEQAKAHDPEILAAVIERALTATRWKAMYRVRPDKARTALDYLPARTADKVLKTALGLMAKKYSKG